MSALQLPAISIEDCYRMVRENYPLIHQYGLTEMMSRYSFENAAMGYVPRISLSAQASYQSDAVAFPEEFNSLLKMAGIEMEGMPKDLYKVQLEISQTLWDGGYAKARREAIKAEQEVSKLTLDNGHPYGIQYESRGVSREERDRDSERCGQDQGGDIVAETAEGSAGEHHKDIQGYAGDNDRRQDRG